MAQIAEASLSFHRGLILQRDKPTRGKYAQVKPISIRQTRSTG